MLEILSSLCESVIDFPRSELASDVWDKRGDTFILKRDVRKKIISFLMSYTELDLLDSKLTEYIHITGSIGTNRYTEETDIDVHLVINPKYFSSVEEQEAITKEILDWSDEKGKNFVGQHPIQVYLQKSMEQEYMSESVYDFVKDKWIIGPDFKPLDYNPYEDYSGIYNSVLQAGGKADKMLGSLNRNIIDYDTVKKAITELPKDKRDKALKFMLKKVKDINMDIAYLSKFKLYYSDLRKAFSNPESIEKALKDKTQLRKWNDVNAIFKFLNRYKYLRIISDLNDLVDDGKLTTKDIKKIPSILKQ